MVRALVATLPAGANPAANAGVTALSRDAIGPFAVRDRGRRDASTRAPSSWRRRRTSTARIVRDRDAELARPVRRDSVRVGRDRRARVSRASAVAHPLNGSGFVVPRVENTGILAASWLSSKWPHRAPDDRVLLRTFVGGARDPRALERSDAELVDAVAATR